MDHLGQGRRGELNPVLRLDGLLPSEALGALPGWLDRATRLSDGRGMRRRTSTTAWLCAPTLTATVRLRRPPNGNNSSHTWDGRAPGFRIDTLSPKVSPV